MNNRIAGFIAFERLEPCAGKLACTVLRGAGSSNIAGLLDFSFVARQKRITLDGDHFYIDLVFYHYVLKCFILIDLKVGKLMHQDIGQMQMYVNYYEKELNVLGDNPPIGIILCADKNDAVAKYTMNENNKQIFASKYKLQLPTEEELQTELLREKSEILLQQNL